MEGVIQAIKKKDIKKFDGTIRIECGDRILNLKVNIDGAKKDIKVLNNKGWSQESSSIQGESNSSVTASTTGLQATPSMGETAEIAQANNAKLQEILARMLTRDSSNNIPATTSEIGSITTTPNTATVNTDRDTAFLIPTGKKTALTGSVGTTALTGSVSTTALTGSVSTTALTGGKTQEPSQLQQGMALS